MIHSALNDPFYLDKVDALLHCPKPLTEMPSAIFPQCIPLGEHSSHSYLPRAQKGFETLVHYKMVWWKQNGREFGGCHVLGVVMSWWLR